MSEFRAADHAMGLELQIEELTEQQRRAVVQGRTDEADRLTAEVEALQAELVATAERVAEEGPGPEEAPELHDAEELSIEGDPQ